MLHAVEREDADRQNQDPRGVQTSADKRLAAESTRGISWKRSWRVQELSLLIKDSRHKLTYYIEVCRFVFGIMYVSDLIFWLGFFIVVSLIISVLSRLSW
jgi:hypothetical protein